MMACRSSAISAGHVDFVLDPEGIAARTWRESKTIRTSLAKMREKRGSRATSGEAQLDQVFQLLRRLTKVDFSDYKQPTILRRMRRRMAVAQDRTICRNTSHCCKPIARSWLRFITTY